MKHRSFILKAAGGLLLALAGITTAAVVRAGFIHSDFYCTQDATGGVCSGSFRTLQETPGLDSAQFIMERSLDGSTLRLFSASMDGVAYSCTAGWQLADMWSVAMATRGYMRITWDANGECKTLRIHNGSPFPDF
ncbi:hypothetical protein WMF31_03020 [Sorangium sp. So ce1036]|uniref:hypothetical protein n=1 Tax=Sorangium sp. So ce1036 TaxID=3133328 RepID=UPI003F0D8206